MYFQQNISGYRDCKQPKSVKNVEENVDFLTQNMFISFSIVSQKQDLRQSLLQKKTQIKIIS